MRQHPAPGHSSLETMTQQDYPPDFRALCVELVDNLERYQSWYIEDNGYGIPDLEALLRRADAALAQPKPQQKV